MHFLHEKPIQNRLKSNLAHYFKLQAYLDYSKNEMNVTQITHFLPLHLLILHCPAVMELYAGREKYYQQITDHSTR